MPHTFTEGGQITSHRLRMLKQVIKMAMLGAFLCGFVYFCYLMLSVPKWYYIGIWYSAKAYFLKSFVSYSIVDKEFIQFLTGQRYTQDLNLPIDQVLTISWPVAKHFLTVLLDHFKEAIQLACFSFISIIVFFYLKGRSTQRDKQVSGMKIHSPFFLRWSLKLKRKASKIKIGKIPLVKGSETRHMMITGGTGSGKTNCLHHILKQIRDRGDKAIIVDTNGTFLEKYYSANDIILNPLNECGAPWHPWAEGIAPVELADLADSFIPNSHSEHDNYWRIAAKSLFTALLEQFADSKKSSELVRWIQYESLNDLCALLVGTPAAAHMDLSSERTASSIRSVASTYLQSLRSLKDTTTPFSIREWMCKEDRSWLFLYCSPQQRSLIKPLISVWLSCAIRALINMPVDLNRRIWFIIDELPTLHKVKDLETLLTEGRKYGGCGVIVLQTPAQISEIYGKDAANVIFANTATKIVFQEEDPVIAEHISKAFGENEVIERHEGLSFGAHETRDSVNLSQQKKQRPTLSPTKIMQLKVNTAFVKLASGMGIAQVRLPICK